MRHPALKRLKTVDDRTDIYGSYDSFVIPTGHPYLLPDFNEYTLASGRALPGPGTYTFTRDFETDFGIMNLNMPWIACYNSQGSEVDYFEFTAKPIGLKIVIDDAGFLSKITIYPGNGIIYPGKMIFHDLSLDSNSDLIPDFLDKNVTGSLAKFLRPFSVVGGSPGLKQFLTADGKEFLTADGKYLFVRA